MDAIDFNTFRTRTDRVNAFKLRAGRKSARLEYSLKAVIIAMPDDGWVRAASLRAAFAAFTPARVRSEIKLVPTR